MISVEADTSLKTIFYFSHLWFYVWHENKRRLRAKERYAQGQLCTPSSTFPRFIRVTLYKLVILDLIKSFFRKTWSLQIFLYSLSRSVWSLRDRSYSVVGPLALDVPIPIFGLAILFVKNIEAINDKSGLSIFPIVGSSSTEELSSSIINSLSI